jgi:hypothetical protein
MSRRKFITLLGGAAAGWPLGLRAQGRTVPVIGLLASESPELWADRMRAFRSGLSDAGYVEGRNVAIEYRWALSEYSRLPAMATDLVDRRVAVIAVPGSTISGEDFRVHPWRPPPHPPDELYSISSYPSLKAARGPCYSAASPTCDLLAL